MTSCNYRVLNDIYNTIEEELTAISEKIENLELNIDIAEIDVDLDNIERQLTLNNKLRLLELVGVDVMSEEEQLAAYKDIKNELFAPTASGGTMEEEDGEF